MATKKKAEKKPPPKKAAKKKAGPADNGQTEDLSQFQETEKTGRTNTGKEKKHASLTIEKVKLNKKVGLHIGFLKIEKGGTSVTSPSEYHDAPVHDDLKAAFRELRVHFALICGYLSVKQIKDVDSFDPSLIENFQVKAVSIGGNNDDKGVTLSGNLTLANGKVHNFNSPFYPFEEVEEKRYRHMDKLQAAVDNVIQETKEYLGGKRGPDPEPELPFPEAGDEETGEEKEKDHSENDE